MQTVLITGATGLLGRAIYQQFKTQGYPVIGCGFSRAKAPILSLDLGDQHAVADFIKAHKPNVVIHAAAERRPDACENNQAATLALNLAATSFLAEQCKALNIRFFFISTDYVFDGTTPPYAEDATVNPLNFYGKTKALAEQAIKENSAAHTIIRVPVLYGAVETLGESAVTVIAEQLKNNPSTPQDNLAVRFPTHVDDIANTLVDLVALEPQQTSGIFHITNHQAMTKYEMALRMADILAIDRTRVIANNTPAHDATRPQNCALKDTRLAKLNICHQRDFASALQRIL